MSPIIFNVIDNRTLDSRVEAWLFWIHLMVSRRHGVSWALKKLCRPAEMCICRTVDRYTFMVECEMFSAARWVVNRIRVASKASMWGNFIALQKDVNLCWPAEYVVLVVVAKPLL